MRLFWLTLVFAAAKPAVLPAQDIFIIGVGGGSVFEPEPELKVPLDSLFSLVQRQPLDAIAHQALGVALVIRKRPDEAERAFRRAISIDPRLADAWFGLSVVPYCRLRVELRMTGRDATESWAAAQKEGERARRRALQLDPLVDLRLYWLMVPRFSGQVDWQTPKSSVAWLEGTNHLRQGDYEKAYLAFNEAVRRGPQQTRPGAGTAFISMRAEAAARAGRLPEAIADTRTLLQRILERDSPDSLRLRTDRVANDVRYRLGMLLQRAGRNEEAMTWFREVLTQDLSFDLAHVRLADLHEAAGQLDLALAERRRAVETNPDDPASVLELGITLGRAGQSEEARDVLLRARRANPDEVRAHFALAQTYYVLGDEAEARIQLRQFLELAPARFASLRREATQLLAELQ